MVIKRELNSEELQAVQVVRESADNPSCGLPEEIFELVSSMVPMINVDLFCQDEQGRVLMIWREDATCGCGWHIPDGIIRFQESIEDRLQRTAQNELGTQIRFDPRPMAINEIILPQDVRGHFISLLYRCYLPGNFPALPVANPEKCYQAGDMYWHSVCPQQWVKGQKRAYSGLFEQTKDIAFISSAERMRTGNCTIVFDIDGVIAKFDPTLRYDQAGPVSDIISIINHLYDCGNKIILFTARGSETGIDWSQTTEEQMKRWGVKYHELRFGKPAATFYVDDKNLSLSELTALADFLSAGRGKCSG